MASAAPTRQMLVRKNKRERVFSVSRIVSYYIISHRILSYRILSYRIVLKLKQCHNRLSHCSDNYIAMSLFEPMIFRPSIPFNSIAFVSYSSARLFIDFPPRNPYVSNKHKNNNNHHGTTPQSHLKHFFLFLSICPLFRTTIIRPPIAQLHRRPEKGDV